jgi:cobalamin biosynthesis protein CobD/CbiB
MTDNLPPDVRELVEHLQRRQDDTCDEAAQALLNAYAEIGRVKDAGTKLALAAGVLNVALDGQEKYRGERQAVVNAMHDFRAALKEGNNHG